MVNANGTKNSNPHSNGIWTIQSLAIYNEALREADEKFQQERDRRYNEVNIEKEKALKIKETADLAALQLARDIQIYKDEKANELREQISSERGNYASHSEIKGLEDKIFLQLRPMVEFISSQQGKAQGIQLTATSLFSIVAAMGTITFIIGHFMK